jgi:hypothetical protein
MKLMKSGKSVAISRSLVEVNTTLSWLKGNWWVLIFSFFCILCPQSMDTSI